MSSLCLQKISDNANNKLNPKILDCRNFSFYSDFDLDERLCFKVQSLFANCLENLTYEDS